MKLSEFLKYIKIPVPATITLVKIDGWGVFLSKIKNDKIIILNDKVSIELRYLKLISDFDLICDKAIHPPKAIPKF